MCSINKYLTEKMIDYHIIEPEDIEIYTYGLTNGFIIIANILTTLLFACLIEKIDIAIIMLLSFIPLRSFSGGMHCKSKTACYMISNIIILILLIAQNYFLKFPLFLLCITLISGIYIFSIKYPIVIIALLIIKRSYITAKSKKIFLLFYFS